MIKFFRKIRQKLLSDNKFSKYLIYAIGEIVLVVIGILIALSINNWNQSRQQYKILNNIYATIKSDLQEDIKNIDKVVSASQPLEKVYLAIVNNTLNKEEFKNCDKCWQVNMGYADIELRKSGIELLLEFKMLDNNSTDSLALNLKRFYIDSHSNIEEDVDEIIREIDYFLANIRQTESWLPDLVKGIQNESFIEYATTNIGYRNSATIIHYIIFVKYIPHLKAYKKSALEYISLIDQKLRNY